MGNLQLKNKHGHTRLNGRKQAESVSGGRRPFYPRYLRMRPVSSSGETGGKRPGGGRSGAAASGLIGELLPSFPPCICSLTVGERWDRRRHARRTRASAPNSPGSRLSSTQTTETTAWLSRRETTPCSRRSCRDLVLQMFAVDPKVSSRYCLFISCRTNVFLSHTSLSQEFFGPVEPFRNSGTNKMILIANKDGQMRFRLQRVIIFNIVYSDVKKNVF